MKPLTVSLLLAVAVAGWLLPDPEARQPDGVLVPEDPQQDSPGNSTPWNHHGYRLTPLATFRIRARVLLKERYWLGRESAISPLDLSLGWGFMSDSATLRQFSIYRGHRCVYWKPLSETTRALLPEVTVHAANIHIVPSTGELASALAALKRGSVIELGGRLVQADAPDGWSWRSSLRRDDSGPGACELLWVEWMRPE